MMLRTWLVGALLLALQGCAGTPSALSAGDRAALTSLSLFDAHDGARFAVELTCTGEEASCNTVEHAFSAWADHRHIALRDIAADELGRGRRSRHPNQISALPYRLAVTFAPSLVPSIDMTHVDQSGGLYGAGYTPPRVSYNATIRVFDATSGVLLKELPASQHLAADYHADANGYIRAEVNRLIASLDPAYRP